MKEASKAVHALPALLMLPVATLVLSSALAAYALAVGVLLASTGDVIYGRQGFGQIDISDVTWGAILVHTLGALWMLVFLRHVQHATVAGAVSQWYFMSGASDTATTTSNSRPVLRSLGLALGRHMGSPSPSTSTSTSTSSSICCSWAVTPNPISGPTHNLIRYDRARLVARE